MRSSLRCLLIGIAIGSVPAFAQDRADALVDATLSAIVRVDTKVVADARTAATLGSRRSGSGALVREGFVLTIGYLVIEAESIEVTTGDGKTVPATLAAYDHASGFGLVKLSAPIPGMPLRLGDAATLAENDPALVVGHGGRGAASLVSVASRRAFSGGWEYLLESAIYTFPPVPNWSGAALIGTNGELLGVGSLIVADAGGGGTQAPGNLFVPIDLVKPILDDLIARGRAAGPVRPWLGVYVDEVRGRLFVSRVSSEGPAERAGLHRGDLVLAVGEHAVGSLADFYRRVWARGAAGVDVPLRVLQGAEVREIRVRSGDRLDYLRRAPRD